ncbi:MULTISPECIES: PTS sugar transporter subunit IIB [Lactiplantibacillus]|jgi:PTS system cellobiose-specific IIB component|uniref:Transcription antiterminator n=1 Tax=Lactiplantibacillus pentosus TaxID=1589 RepID=A0A2K9I4I5_LACPE|nr:MULTISPECIES: transcription antiterminator [Lactiplantibacillus]MCH4130307.1 transcription antiterminator [Lactiplantibacillus sp.]AUI79905.1 transcription antiterminator [Lactiplantibacillus pentosus]MBO9165348.1 transcription antiterminator [Lactiplantibacillus pentosus]MBU7462442.1 transcription antiterminator [Lactiplantibacillus pentosus]MBU7478863.1 transcription antiterminator [Lactiplantibacillus pentosus]
MAQLKIALFCSGGMSTSLVGSKMQKVYDAEHKDVKVDAYDLGMVDEIGSDVDVIMLAPQIGWSYDQVKQSYPDTKVIKLTMQEFGSMDGQVLVNRLAQEGIEG